jgi:hypothetical protein
MIWYGMVPPYSTIPIHKREVGMVSYNVYIRMTR